MTERAAALAALFAALGALAACEGRGVDSCRDDLGGVWRADARAASGEPVRVHLLDRGAAIEAYPIGGDTPPVRGATAHDTVIVAPAVIDLARRGDELTGTLTRRFVRGDRTCSLRTPARLHGCRGARATLDIAPAGEPTDWTLCAPGPAAPVTWALTKE